jgi:hypothetical protein
MDTIHAFEKAGLGQAPFRLVGFREERGPKIISQHGGVTLTAGAPGQPMGSCRFCGTGIANVFEILSADGKHFDVGSECVHKVGDAGLKKAVNKKLRTLQKANEARRIERAIERLGHDQELQGQLCKMPHPLKWHADAGKTRFDWAMFMFMCAGHAGKLKVTRWLDKTFPTE